MTVQTATHSTRDARWTLDALQTLIIVEVAEDIKKNSWGSQEAVRVETGVRVT